MKKILCPTDFSDAAHNAIAYAAKFCHATDSTMTLFNVQSIFNLSPLELVAGKNKTAETVAQQLENKCQEVERVFKISCDAEVQTTSKLLSKVIEQKASQFDLIIMGTEGTHDLYSFFAGSNAYNAIRSSNIPALLIPAGYVYAPIETVVYAYNYLEEAKLPISQLSPWLKKFHAGLLVLEVMEGAFSKDADEELQDMQEIMQLKYPNLSMRFHSIRSSDKPLSIHNYVMEKNADLLTLCSKHRGLLASLFHKSVIKSISAMATYPVFVVHE